MEVAVTRDVLVIVVPLRESVADRNPQTREWETRGARYPSNGRGSVAGAAKFGKKTVDAKALADDVEEAAKRAVAAGWKPVEHVGGARASVTRYVPDERVFDAWNLGQTEANALTRAGVWNDDSLPRPVTLDVQSGDDGPDRVVIVVQRLAVLEGARRRDPRPQAPKRARGSRRAERPNRPLTPSTVPEIVVPTDASRPAISRAHGGVEIPPGMALLDGKPVPRDEALAILRKAGKIP